jgi:hypothetical protein
MSEDFTVLWERESRFRARKKLWRNENRSFAAGQNALVELRVMTMLGQSTPATISLSIGSEI